MKWTERSGQTIEAGLIVMVIIALAILFLMVSAARAGGCLSIDVPPHVVVNVHDGDTFSVFTFAPPGKVNIRVRGIDTPELNQPKGSEATAFTRQWLSRGVFKVMTCGELSFDRIVAIVERDGESLADALKKAGFSK